MSDCYTQTVNEVYYNFKLITSATLAHGFYPYWDRILTLIPNV